MLCCVLIALAFALPILAARTIFGAFGGGNYCSMAWRPASNNLPDKTRVAVSLKRRVPGNSAFTDADFSISGRVKSFVYAGRGAYRLLRYEHSAWIQLTLAGIAVAGGLLLHISSEDWRWIVLVIGLVLSAEGLNTAIEKACDRISLEYSERIKAAKDVAAGAVLLSSVTAAIIGVQTLLPYVVDNKDIFEPVVSCGAHLAAMSGSVVR